jgi:aryl-alcohol dehydrogenase-like predicted oxidoreductase
MEYRRLGSTGMYVSEISYGNWITHGNQIESDAAIKCVKAALEVGITTFDTADVYAGTKAEVVLGKALKGVKRESYELFTKVYWPTGTGKNDRGLSRKHIIESCNASLKRLQTDHIDLYQMHRFDYETPIEERSANQICTSYSRCARLQPICFKSASVFSPMACN